MFCKLEIISWYDNIHLNTTLGLPAAPWRLHSEWEKQKRSQVSFSALRVPQPLVWFGFQLQPSNDVWRCPGFHFWPSLVFPLHMRGLCDSYRLHIAFSRSWVPTALYKFLFLRQLEFEFWLIRITESLAVNDKWGGTANKALITPLILQSTGIWKWDVLHQDKILD